MKRKRTGITDLIRMMKAIEGHVARCSRCGMCQAVCPLYNLTGHEKDVARGKLMLLDGLMREMFDDPDGVLKRINHCLLCGACEAGCPRQVRTLEIFLTARSIIVGYIGLSPLKKILFRKIMMRPEFFNKMGEWGASIQHLILRPAAMRPEESCAHLVSPILSNRLMVPLAPIPFHKMKIHSIDSNSHSGVRVAFFVGCLLDKIFPDIAKQIVDVLTFHGASVFVPPSQGCCGIPLLADGDQETFNRLVGYHLDLFDENRFDYLVTGCATCTAVIKKIWPTMAKSDSAQRKEKIVQLAEKTYDISQFLVNIIGIADKNVNKDQDPDRSKVYVTIHDSCHLRRTLKIYKEPRKVVAGNSNYTIQEMPESDACCGMGGSFNLKHYKTSIDIGLKKVENIKASGASVVATGCPACMIQLNDVISKTNTPVKVKHFIEIYSEELFRNSSSA